MAKYKLSHTDNVLDTDKQHWIPNSNENRHWREYQQWLLIPGNVPDPADPVPPPVLPPVVTRPTAADNSVASMRAKINEIMTALIDAGLMREL